MFSGNLEPQSHKYVTVQLASGSDDLSICPATNPQKMHKKSPPFHLGCKHGMYTH